MHRDAWPAVAGDVDVQIAILGYRYTVYSTQNTHTHTDASPAVAGDVDVQIVILGCRNTVHSTKYRVQSGDVDVQMKNTGTQYNHSITHT